MGKGKAQNQHQQQHTQSAAVSCSVPVGAACSSQLVARLLPCRHALLLPRRRLPADAPRADEEAQDDGQGGGGGTDEGGWM